MFLFYVLSFFKKGDTIQGGHYLRKYGRFAPYLPMLLQNILLKKVLYQCFQNRGPQTVLNDSKLIFRSSLFNKPVTGRELLVFLNSTSKVHIFWEGHEILRNIHRNFTVTTYSLNTYMNFTWNNFNPWYCWNSSYYKLESAKINKKKYFPLTHTALSALEKVTTTRKIWLRWMTENSSKRPF